MVFKESPKIAVIGLGYVGLPLAVALAKSYDVIGLDVKQKRIEELQDGHDATGEVEPAKLKSSTVQVTSHVEDIRGCDVYIVTVPTPITDAFEPDLKPLELASHTIGKIMGPHSIIVYESTVYPGVTEDVCAPILEKESGLKSGKDFFLGYSPERMNPGDKKHTVETITKVVAGQTPEVGQYLAKIYGSVNNGNIFVAKNIKTAEAAKVIENTQRDINIAFMNEIAGIFGQMDLSIHDVLAAARTKWNFLPFTPGLVGGHCIGVDPYYLAHLSRTLNHEPQVILAGRRVNEDMSRLIADRLNRLLPNKPAKILVLGLTFKEDVPDLRNTKIIDLIQALQKFGHHIDVHDAFADPEEAQEYYQIDLLPTLGAISGAYDMVLGAVSHDPYTKLSIEEITDWVMPGGIIADLKAMWAPLVFPQTVQYWAL
jgi:UDP-N-acetyl-D-galactosamine dehydrogenase